MAHDPKLERPRQGPASAWVSAVLGIWLFVSTFIWPHPGLVAFDTIAVAVLLIAVAVLTQRWHGLIFVNVALALWLLGSSLAFHSIARLTVWNNGVVAALVILSSLFWRTPAPSLPPEPNRA